MSVPVDTTCLECYLVKNMKLAESLGGREKALEFSRRLMELYLRHPDNTPMPILDPHVADLFWDMYGLDRDRYRQEKIDSNRFVLERMDRLRSWVEGAPDPVYAGLQFSILGNYIDFAALQDQVDFSRLDAMLAEGLQLPLDREVYARLCADLEQAETLLYVTDNAGEIGFDRLLAEELVKKYPRLKITFCVRGAIGANDATREDAQAVGIPFPVIDNGCRITGTYLPDCGEECRKAVMESHVVIAKGMANTETMFGCGANVYYAFLIKCKHISDFFGKPLFTPMLVRER